MTRLRGQRNSLFEVREYAMALLDIGKTQKEVARTLKKSQGTISIWRKAYLKNGKKGLKRKFTVGRPRKLNNRNIRKLVGLLKKKAPGYGYKKNKWTLKRIAKVIRKEYGISFHICHISRLIKKYHLLKEPERFSLTSDQRALLKVLHQIRIKMRLEYEKKCNKMESFLNDKYRAWPHTKAKRLDSYKLFELKKLFRKLKKITKEDIRKRLGWSVSRFNPIYKSLRCANVIHWSSTRGFIIDNSKIRLDQIL